MAIEILEYGNYYHIYTHAVGGRNLFKVADNYDFFLHQYEKYISPVADTYAWVLMPNHLHLLVRMKEEDEILHLLHLTGFKNLSGVKDVNDDVKIKPLHQYFSNLFNSYTKAFNKWHGARGALFERPFKRKLIDSEDYLRSVLLYIHNNPVHHGFCDHPIEYPWSSYLTCLSIRPTKLQREQVVGWFDDEANFKYMHDKKVQVMNIEEWLEM